LQLLLLLLLPSLLLDALPAVSLYKELVDKVHAAPKAAIKETQTDIAHGMPMLSHILSAVRMSLKRGMP